MSSFFHSSEAFLIPSLYEGFGLPALEAMASGAPVISSTGGSLPEVCGDAALFFDPADAEGLANHMIRLCADPSLRVKLVSAGKQRAQQFTYGESARRILEVYRRLLCTERSPAPVQVKGTQEET
jgi:glycosyltransferase involved in cell wall biosynthesis